MNTKVLCPVCELPCDKLDTDRFVGVDWQMCEKCKRATDIMDCPEYLVDPRFNLLGLDETDVAYMRRMHEVLLPAEQPEETTR